MAETSVSIASNPSYSNGLPNCETLKLYNQFLLDIPRLDLFIDRSPYDGDTTTLFMTLWTIFREDQKQNRQSIASRIIEKFSLSKKSELNGYGNRDDEVPTSEDENEVGNQKAAKSLTYCTQTALAYYYEKAHKRWCTNYDSYHLIDGGRQYVNIQIKEEPQQITIRKPFKLVDMASTNQSGGPVTVKIVELTLVYSVSDDVAKESWSERSGENDEEWVFL